MCVSLGSFLRALQEEEEKKKAKAAVAEMEARTVTDAAQERGEGFVAPTLAEVAG
jgi:hypothetical protein